MNDLFIMLYIQNMLYVPGQCNFIIRIPKVKTFLHARFLANMFFCIFVFGSTVLHFFLFFRFTIIAPKAPHIFES